MYNSISSFFKKLAVGAGALYAAATLSLVPVLAIGSTNFGVDNAKGLNVQDGSLLDNVTNIINTVFLLLGIVAVGFIVWSGISIITSKDNEEKLKKAQKYLINAVIGFVLIALSWTIVSFIIAAINSGESGSEEFQTEQLS
ncbi:MAG: pilin [Candidatus Gracilibacteria bacterium]